MILDLERFIRINQPHWEQYEALLNRLSRQGKQHRLGLAEARELFQLHQRVAADLAQVRTFASEPATTSYLEALVARGYAEMRINRSQNLLRTFGRWFWWEIPACVQRGRRSLRARLREVLPDVCTLAGLLSLMLIWAGLIESYLSQTHEPAIPYAVKIVFGLVQLMLLTWFLFRPIPFKASPTPQAHG